MNHFFALTFVLSLGLPFDWQIPSSDAQDTPAADPRLAKPKDVNTLRSFPTITSRAQWEQRAREIREQILVSCGLWPMPEKTLLKAEIFGRIERDGYTVEKVFFQSYPGFYVAGNLYRPLGNGAGPFPGVLNPHGHWKNGRMADEASGSIAARCINFARQGMVAFSYDMVGYNDTIQVNHTFASSSTNQLWNISLMGLQSWNSVRALDFLESLPDVDKSRLACTGESGGGTQTFMLGAIDRRLATQAPIVMVSHSMQGGCLCENAPGLRVEYSNMEIAAVPAPRPQILVGATGDWTKATLTVEGPALEKIYRLFNAGDNLRYVRFDFDHNYNQTSREAVYESFGKWLLHHPDPASLKETSYTKEPDHDLRVWPDGKLPGDALDEDQLIASLIKRYQGQLHALQPKDLPTLEKYKKLMLPAWHHTFQIDPSDNHLSVEVGSERKIGSYTLRDVQLACKEQPRRVATVMITPQRDRLQSLVVLAHPTGKAAYLDAAGSPIGLAKNFLERGQAVVLLDTFLTGERANAEAAKGRNPFASYFTTYNRTDLQERVNDLILACEFAHTHSKGRKVVLCGTGRAGLWTLLAAPAADGVASDCDTLDLSTDMALMQPDLFVPGLRKIGGFEGVAMLAAPNSLLLHNTGDRFSTEQSRQTYSAINATKQILTENNKLSEDAIADWVVTRIKSF